MERCLWGCLTDDSGERLNGIQEVSGSIPLISTNNKTVRPTPYGLVLSTVQIHLPASRNN